MPEGEASQTQNPSQNASRGASRARRGRGRGGRGRGQLHGPAQGTQGQPVSPPDSSENPSIPTADLPQHESATSANSSRPSRGGRGRRGPRQSERGGARHSAPRAPQPGPSRRFGGHLTVEADDAAPGTPSLSAEAVEFVPGQPVLPRVKPRQSEASKQPEVRLPKSTAADLGTRIHEDISNGNYECAVCTDEVLRKSHVWSCNVCWTVVHLNKTLPGHQRSRKRRIYGDVPAVTPNYPMSQAHTTAGVERTLTRDPPVPRFLHTRADRHAQNPGEHALILVASNATLALVRRVPSWGLHSLAFVGRTPPRNCAERPTTKMAGAARRFAAIFCPVESIFAQIHAILDSVETAI
ncbi:hypothetical protein ACHAQJ_007041 [Trichoderma viride]